MNPDAPFAASRFVAYPRVRVTATLAGMAARSWSVTLPSGCFTLGLVTAEADGGDALLCPGGALVSAAQTSPVDVEVTLQSCGERATELLLRLRWSKATPVGPARLEAGLLLATLGMDRLAADLAAGCTRRGAGNGHRARHGLTPAPARHDAP